LDYLIIIFSAVILLSISSALLGSYLVVEERALLSDALSHSILPGVILGFFLSEDKNPWLICGLALVAGMLGTILIHYWKQHTKLKQDSLLAVLLAGFFAIGIVLESIYNPVGVRYFLFGQLSSVNQQDLLFIAGHTLITVIYITVFWRQLHMQSFNPQVANLYFNGQSIVKWGFEVLLIIGLVLAMQAVGMILVAAWLIIPALSARFCVDRLISMQLWSIIFSLVLSSLAVWLSWIYQGLAVGPLMILLFAIGFVIAFLVSPKKGLIKGIYLNYLDKQQHYHEHNLKLIYKALEKKSATPHLNIDLNQTFSLLEIAHQLPMISLSDLDKRFKSLFKSQELLWLEESKQWQLSQKGQQTAKNMVKKHRLWELYLSQEANYKADHVHLPADKVEHYLDDKALEQLDKLLGYPKLDPHGKLIPR